MPQLRNSRPAPRKRQQNINASPARVIGANDLRILHAYKLSRPDIEGGIPAVMSSLAQASDPAISHSILCARRRGAARQYVIDAISVEAVASLGTLFSTPLAAPHIPALTIR